MITEEQIQAVVRRIVEGYAPDRIILFGSYAYGEPTEHSDLDLLVVKDNDESPKRERQQQVKQLLYSDLWDTDVDIASLNASELHGVSANRCCREYVALHRGRILHGVASRPARISSDAPLSSQEKTVIRRLIKSAEQDMAAAREVVLRLNYYDIVARTSQFAAEKILKARLMSLRAQLPAGHSLSLLLAAIEQKERVEASVCRKIELLSPFAALFHDYSFTVASPPATYALIEAAAAIYQTFTPSIRQSLT
jgi:HEPN domain-containing protein/predicted nucleotidyltransferase